MDKDNLIWTDTREVKFDTSINFNPAYDFEGWHYMRQEAETCLGRFAVWEESHNNYALYGGCEGWYQNGFKTLEEAKLEVEIFTKKFKEVQGQ